MNPITLRLQKPLRTRPIIHVQHIEIKMKKQNKTKKRWELPKKLVYKLNLFQCIAELSVRAKEKFDVNKPRKYRLEYRSLCHGK